MTPQIQNNKEKEIKKHVRLVKNYETKIHKLIN